MTANPLDSASKLRPAGLAGDLSSGAAAGRGASQGVQQWTVGPEQAGQRIDNFLLTRLKGVPKTRIYRMLRTGEVRVNGGRIGSDYRIEQGDVLRIPPLRLFRNGAIDPDLERLLAANSRRPAQLLGDLGAQWTALARGEAALADAAACFGERFDMMETTFYVSRETVVPTLSHKRIAFWRARFFAIPAHQAILRGAAAGDPPPAGA